MRESPREILKKSEIKNKLKECFKKCAVGRQDLRICVTSSMDSGLTKEEILSIIKNMGSGGIQDEASLCSIVAIGQAMRYEEKNGNFTNIVPANNGKKSAVLKLQKCLRKCSSARKRLRKCVANALDAGLSKEEILAFTDELVGGVGRDDVSLCGIIATDQVLRYEESVRAKPLDIVNEREIERD
jgi:hypothetical protein